MSREDQLFYLMNCGPEGAGDLSDNDGGLPRRATSPGAADGTAPTG